MLVYLAGVVSGIFLLATVLAVLVLVGGAHQRRIERRDEIADRLAFIEAMSPR